MRTLILVTEKEVKNVRKLLPNWVQLPNQGRCSLELEELWQAWLCRCGSIPPDVVAYISVIGSRETYTVGSIPTLATLL